jgi:hypothetical protein
MKSGMSLLCLLVGIPMAFIWRAYPGLFTCCIFWLAMILFNFTVVRGWLFTPGCTCNALATIFNGGFMPAIDDGTPFRSEYIPLTSDNALPYLCDRFWGGSSVGDFLLLGAVIISISIWAAGKFMSPSARRQAG